MFINGIDTINDILEKYNPDILAISEANIIPEYINILNMFSKYKFELPKMFNCIGLARNSLLIKNNIPYVQPNDFETDEISSVWVEILLKGGKKLLVSGAYCQWRVPGMMDPSQISHKNVHQIERLQKFIDLWKQACNEGK